MKELEVKGPFPLISAYWGLSGFFLGEGYYWCVVDLGLAYM